MAIKVENKTAGYHPLYVICRDKFMSGWGAAGSGPSYYALGADSQEEAEIVLRNAQDRSDMRACSIKTTWLGLEKKRNGHASIVDRAEAPRWYDPSRPFRK